MKFKPQDADDAEEKVEWDNCKCVGETDMKIKVVGVEDSPIWFPKGAVHDDSEVYKTGTDGTFVLKRWWAKKQGLI